MTENSSRQNETPLESWKEIAAYLKRDVRTVKRWEKHEALPVRRHLHQARSSVYAYPSELEAWKAAREPGFDQAPLAMPWRRPIPALGFALTLLLALVSVASGPILTPPGALAQEASGMTARQAWAGLGVDFHGVPSPDGRYLPYINWETGDLGVRDLQNGKNRLLTDNNTRGDTVEQAHTPVPSPDGAQIAYGWLNERYFYELRVIGIDGSGPRVLYRNEEMAYLQPEAWSPDAKHILAQFTRKDGANQIGWVSVADGSVQVLKTMDWRYPLEVSLSPDGRFLAYDLASQQDSSQRDIFLLAADGSQELPLVQHPANDLLLGWSPNGQYILFASDRTGTMDMWLLPVDEATPTGSLQLLKRGVGRVRPMGFTQSGAFYYAVPTGMNDVYTASVDLAAGMVLTGPSRVTESSVGSNTLPAWSPEGRYLTYVSQPPDEHFSIGFDSQITIREVETGSERQFRPQLTHIGDLRWAPDGQHLLLVGYDKNRVYSRSLYRMHIESGEITPILRSQYESSVYEIISGPEGNGIFYHQDDLAVGACRFLTLDMESGEEKELLRVVRPSFAGVLALSPDGRYLTFTRLEPQARTLEVMPAQGGQAAELLRLEDKSEYITGVAWTPDGRYILFARSKLGSGAALWRIPAAGGEPEKLGLTQEGLLRHLRVHPQGKQIAFMAAMPYKPEVWVLENFLPKLEAKAARLEDE